MPRRRAVLLPAVALALARVGASSGSSAPATADPQNGTGREGASAPPRREEPRALRGRHTADGDVVKLPRRVAAAVPSVSQLQWTDTNQQGGEIGGGVVSWTPPADVSSIDSYQVYIAHDSLGTYQAQLWWSNAQTEQFSFDFPVGTNSFTLFQPTRRKTTNSAYPANWLLVYSKSGGTLQATADAAKIPIYDISGSAPSAVDLIIDTSATYLTGSSTVAGTVQWSPAEFADLGFVENYSVYVAPAAGDTGNEVSIQDVPLGTNELILAGSKTCAEGSYLAVYAQNPNGRASSASWQPLQACPVTTLAATTAAPTTTAAVASGTLVFSDTDSEANQIGGAVLQWTPTTDTTATHYQVYIANDEQGSYKALLWHTDPTTGDVVNILPVGTNEFHVFDPTVRRTTDSTYPANWVILYTSNSGTLQDVGNALKVRLYDLSTSVPSYVPMEWVTVFDIDWTDERIVGSVQWSVSTQADVALATEFSVYMARDAAGTGEAYISTVSIGTNRILFSADCWDRNYMLVYANNPNGRATQAASTVVTGCTTAVPGGDPTTTTVATTVRTTTTSGSTSVSSVQFTDFNMEANQIGGSIIQWAPATDTSSVASYQVHLSNDQLGSHKVSLWYSDPVTESIDSHFPVGTNKFWIFEPTIRATADPAYPANWVIVFSVDTSGAVQAVENAVKVPLYDISSSNPGSPSLTFDSSGTYLSGGEIAGSVQWSVASAKEDLGFTEHLAVYLAADAGGSGEVNVLNASRASDTFTLPAGSTCADRSYLALYAENPNGKALAASWQLLVACTATTSTMLPATTTTTTTTPGPTTTTAAPLATRISGLTFTDMNPTRSEIGGAVVSWIPPSDVSNVVRYDVYISYDLQGSYEAQLWWENSDTGEIGRGVPVGTNQITLFHSTTRRTMRSGYPATYLIVYTHDGSQRQASDDAVSIPIYDDSGGRPFPVFFEWIRFSDMDWADERIFGVLSWSPTSLSDLALAIDYNIYLSQNTMGVGKVQIASAPIGTTAIFIPYGTYCWNYKYILIYASNPYGEAFFGASTYLDGCNTPEPTTTATTITTTVTTTTMSTVTGQTTETASTSTASTSTVTTSTVTITTTVEPWLMTNLVFTDTNTEANQIGGATVQWTPPSDTSTITSYRVYISYDDLGSQQVQLWYADPATEQLGFAFPVGTNSFTIYSPTARQTADPAHPANWVLVYTMSGTTLQSVSDAAKVRLYDASANVPGSLSLTLDFTDQDAADATIAGTLKWTLPSTTVDLGFTSHYAVYLASSAAGDGRTSLLSVPVGTNEVEIPSGTACWSNNYLLVYASNPNGNAATASSKVLSGCTTPAP